MSGQPSLLESPDRVLSTLEKDGSRRWLYPRLARGRFWRWRMIAAWSLIAVFTLLPYIQINGRPAVLLDLVHRRFTLFGYTFLPTDTRLLAVLMVGLVLGIFCATALLGRLWCGWACPQTVYMEFVFRPMERLLLGRRGTGGRPPADVAIWRRLILYVGYLAVSFFLAHTFLAYWVGVDQLRTWVFHSPADHPAAFAVVVAVTGLMLFDFVYFREQTCIIACPYGRFQSALLDRNSLIIAYDPGRGEPRGKRAAGADSPPVAGRQMPAGDCVDCGLCAAVCPTGIDIRDGLQIECIGCAQCIDACDGVMARLKRPPGLVRYTSQAALSGERQRVVRARVLIYAGMVMLLGGLLGYLVITKSPVDMILIRNIGMPFVMRGEIVENTIKVKLTNRLDRPQELRIEVPDHPEVTVESASTMIRMAPGEVRVEPVRVMVPAERFAGGKLEVKIRVRGENGLIVDRECRLLGPVAAKGAS